jgi:hypothetical protein
MACKKSELISAINSFGAARASGDFNLIKYAGDLIVELIETLDFSPEETKVNEEFTEEKN